ncbi:MAG TPA: hypothetical protein DCE71_04565, partial [Parachlamydiales bacterium]|nr:hypothetical protein [Parachlamydiales bacterium]
KNDSSSCFSIKQREFIEAYERLKRNLGPNDELLFLDALPPEYQSQAERLGAFQQKLLYLI